MTLAGDIIDLNLAYRSMLSEKVGPNRATAIADAMVPNDLIQLLANGPLGREAVAAALQSLSSDEPGTRTGDDDAVLVHARSDVRLLSPLPRPTSLRDCSAYELHLHNSTRGQIPPRWYDSPTYYKGNPASVIGDRTDVPLPAGARKCDYELEYAAVIGKTGRDLDAVTALDHIAGYLVFNDVSLRSVQFREMSVGLGPAKSKDLDGTNILGPALVTPDEWDPHEDRIMRAFVNGEEWSSGLTTSIHFSVGEILSHISQAEGLHVGDVIGTGTVGGGSGLEVGRYPESGDTVTLDIEGLGQLSNTWGTTASATLVTE
ncbi:fumarylacetoacetate hydrolase family protein [Nocardioides massiliensis]|uniref:2-keto-4-pentenoate hydratase/2-oxohepta-3-ene-1,7-dioic acid hydratase in catechol pathway n=1 Tax=Nocardioides massiliensis TaxID=1325935 RepID=A0ABT9NK53_9ACTN|nr:fumarylacetoacetate hydrolase family protein [Nocardioides massiliensis]MDP9820795.1 2-keto-4-pentenoate hydratase/2-oxohepta-3-ene-1,7-dioic acid hydratase in catechol pathway [Nocardioides massiliensis]